MSFSQPKIRAVISQTAIPCKPNALLIATLASLGITSAYAADTTQTRTNDSTLSANEDADARASKLLSDPKALGSRVSAVLERSIEHQQPWYRGLSESVINQNPEDNAKLVELDRQGSNEKTSVDGARYVLADADKNQDDEYQFIEFARAALGSVEEAGDITPESDAQGLPSYYKGMYYIYNYGNYATQDDKFKRADSFLKRKFRRGRPYQVLDDDTRKYVDDFREIKGSSYPSGHTWDGYRLANVWSMIFPERGAELYSRALQYGESRTIVNAHFPTDTIASRAGNYYYLANLLDDDETTKTIVDLATVIRSQADVECEDGQSFTECLRTKDTPVTDNYAKDNNEIGYYGLIYDKNAKSTLAADELPKNAQNLLRLRFPYLPDAQRRQILASTAYPKNSIATYAVGNNWGLIDLPKAYAGPAKLDSDWTVNQTYMPEYDIAQFGEYDTWKNDITGNGQLNKTGDGTLRLAGDNSFAAFNVNEGTLELTGRNQLQQKSTVSDSVLKLLENGSLDSDLDVNGGHLLIDQDSQINAKLRLQQSDQQEVLLTGNGYVQTLEANDGSMIAPSNQNGTGVLRVNDIMFNSGSTYRAAVSKYGNSDRIDATGQVTIGDNTTLMLTSEDMDTVLNEEKSRNLLGKEFILIASAQPIEGKFSVLQPDYPFLDLATTYDNNLNVKFRRNDTGFDTVTDNPNEEIIADVVDKNTDENNEQPVVEPQEPVNDDDTDNNIGDEVDTPVDNDDATVDDGNSLGDALTNVKTEQEAKQLLAYSNGQVYSQKKGIQIENQRYLGMLLNQQLQVNLGQHVWGQFLTHSIDKAEQNNIAGYDNDTVGFIVGSDVLANDTGRLGVALAHTQTDSTSAYGDSDGKGWHGVVYGEYDLGHMTDQNSQSATLRGLVIQGFTNTKVKRFNNDNDIDSTSTHLNAQIDVPVSQNLGVYGGASYIRLKQDAVNEGNGITQLRLPEQDSSHSFVTAGVRADQTWASATGNFSVGGSVGWQQRIDGNNEVTAYLSDGNTAFVQRGVDDDDGRLVVGLKSAWQPDANNAVELSLNGSFANNENQYGVNLGYQRKF